MNWTGKAMLGMALGSLIMLLVAAAMLATDRGVGWVFFVVGLVGWVMYLVMIIVDIRRTLRSTPARGDVL